MTKIIPFPAAAEREQAAREHVDKTCASFVEMELAGFAVHLAAARVIWRQYRDLVEAAEFPADLVAAYHHEYPDDDPSEPDVDYGSPFVSAGKVAELREMAEEFARRKGAAS